MDGKATSLCQHLKKAATGREGMSGWLGRSPPCCQHMLLAFRPLLMQSPLPGMPLTPLRLARHWELFP